MDNNPSVSCCYTCIYCNDKLKCTESPLSEKGPVDIPEDLLYTYRCRNHVERYPLDTRKRQLKE